MARRLESPRQVFNRRLQVREDPELAKRANPFVYGAARQKGRTNKCPAVEPSSRSGENIQ